MENKKLVIYFDSFLYWNKITITNYFTTFLQTIDEASFWLVFI